MSSATTAGRNSATWRVRGVSVAGYRHLQEGIECQDAYRNKVLGPRGPVILAVADGAGSRPRAAEGATLAAGIAIEVYSRAFHDGGPQKESAWKPLMRECFELVREQFSTTTSAIGPRSQPHDFATTLTVAVLAREYLGIARLGDGFVIVAVPGRDGDEAAPGEPCGRRERVRQRNRTS